MSTKMRGWLRTAGTVLGSVVFVAWVAGAEQPGATGERSPGIDRGTGGSDTGSSPIGRGDEIYGRELMTQSEIDDYNRRMGSSLSADERERLMNEHRDQMNRRARERGTTLPDVGSGPGDTGGTTGGGMDTGTTGTTGSGGADRSPGMGGGEGPGGARGGAGAGSGGSGGAGGGGGGGGPR
jgi:hypothetical protein